MSSECWPVTVSGWESLVPRLPRSEQKMLVSMLVCETSLNLLALFQTATEIESTGADHTSSILPSSVTSITFIPQATLKPILKTHSFIHKFLRDVLKKVEPLSFESLCDEKFKYTFLMIKHAMKNPNQSSAGSILISSLGFCPQCLTRLPLMSEAEEVPNRN